MSDHNWLIIPGGDLPDGFYKLGSWFCTRCWAKIPRPYAQGGEPPAIMGPCFDRKPGEHRWLQSWPGNHCLDCGLDDPMENTDESLVPCPNCSLLEAGIVNELCQCLGTGCIVNPNLVIPPCPFSTSSVPSASGEPES